MRRAALVLVVCGVALLAYQLTRAREEIRSQARASRDAVSRQEPAETPLLQGDTALEEVTGAVPDERKAVGTASSVAEASFEPPLVEGRVLQVVRALDGAPVPNASVWYLPELSLEAKVRLAGPLKPYGVRQELERHGRRFRADDQGRLLVPAGTAGEHALVCASAPELWGWRELRGDVEATLELEADPTLRLRVVDAHGNPIEGLYVLIRAGSGFVSPTILRTDAEGRAQVPRLRYVIDHQAGDGKAVVVPGALAADTPTLSIESAAIPMEEVELRLPPIGAIEVRLVGADGALLADLQEAVVSLELEESDSGSDLRALPWTNFESVRQGVARFEHVGVGARVSVVCNFQERFRRLHESVEGPAAPGEIAVVALTPRKGRPCPCCSRASSARTAPRSAIVNSCSSCRATGGTRWLASS